MTACAAACIIPPAVTILLLALIARGIIAGS
jgi:hypothetical protein